jgi:hypothetical protein
MVRRRERRLRRARPYIFAVLVLFGWSVFLMLARHIAEFAIWAYAFLHMGLIAHAYDGLYFCANAYTTLGYGSVTSQSVGGTSARSWVFPVCLPWHGVPAHW